MASGHFTTDFFGSIDAAQSIAIQDDGKFYVAGTSSGSFALARYTANGILDVSFSDDGKTTSGFETVIDRAQGKSVAIQPDGKVLVAGHSGSSTFGYKFALARYNSDGTSDSTFDGDGRVFTTFGSSSFGRSVAIQSDGKILVAGGTIDNFALARYNLDGSLDISFGASGKVLTKVGASFGGGEYVTIQSDGKILVSGTGDGSNFAIVRYNTDGTLDVTFDGDGKVLTDFQSQDGGQSVTVQNDGKIVVAGTTGDYSHRDFALVRYNSDGNVDNSFGVSGKVVTDFGAGEQGQSVRIQDDGKILVAGDTGAYPNFNFALARYNTNGSLDATFDGDGKVVTDFGFGASASALSLGLQADGKAILVGYSGDDFALARYNTNGSLDTTFGVATPSNTPPTLSNLPIGGQSITVGTVAALADFTVADADSNTLTVTLTSTNGSLGGLIDANPSLAGIQLTGTASSINTALAGATFTATAVGTASIDIRVSDGVVTTPTSATYSFNATNQVTPPTTTLGPQDDFIVLQPSTPAVAGAGVGNDIYLLSGIMVPAGKKITISDSMGSNVLQLAPGLSITASKVASTALQLILSNGASLTVLGADTFEYEVGANLSAGLDPSNLSYAQFVQNHLGTTVPGSGLVNNGSALTVGTGSAASLLASAATVDDFITHQVASAAIIGSGSGNDTYLLT